MAREMKMIKFILVIISASILGCIQSADLDLKSCKQVHCSRTFDNELRLHLDAVRVKNNHGYSADGMGIQQEQEQKKDVLDASVFSLYQFWGKFKHPFGVTEAKISHTNKIETVGQSIHHYDQFIQGVKVLGARLTLTTGAHGGVIKAAAEHVLDESALAASLVIKANLNHADASSHTKEHILQEYQVDALKSLGKEEVELIFYQPELHSYNPSLSATPVLAYHVNGAAVFKTKDLSIDTLEAMAYNAIVDAETGRMIQFTTRKPQSQSTIKKQEKNQIEETKEMKVSKVTEDTSSSSRRLFQIPADFHVNDFQTLGRELLLYDCSAYIYNYDDSILSECLEEDMNTPIWSSMNAEDVARFPTGDQILDSLIYDAVTFTRLMRGISEQQWQTFQQVSVPMRIFFNVGNYQNAFFWNGRMLFGEGVDVDDILGHEYAHGYIDSTANLAYVNQSGALNEAYADMFGEAFDLLNEPGSIEYRLFTPTCTSSAPYYHYPYGVDPSSTWTMGEGSTLSLEGSIRDMYYPECFGDPGSITSFYYYCGSGDGGGVHPNSGVPNRLFASMVQGTNDVNGDPVPGMGLNKSLVLQWQTLLSLGEFTGFKGYVDALVSQCSAAVGTKVLMPDLLYGDSVVNPTALFTAEDCTNLDKFIENSEILTHTACHSTPYEPVEKVSPTRSPTPASQLVPLSRDPYLTWLDDLPSVISFSGEKTVSLTLCPGVNIQVSVCPFVGGSFTKDPYAYIYYVDGNGEVAFADMDFDYCGKNGAGFHLSFDTIMPCMTYQLEIACSGNTCSGEAVVIAGTRPADVPSISGYPTRTPTMGPTDPTVAPTVMQRACEDTVDWKWKKYFEGGDEVKVGKDVYVALKGNKKKWPVKMTKYWGYVGTCLPCEGVRSWRKWKKFWVGNKATDKKGENLYRAIKVAKGGKTKPGTFAGSAYWEHIDVC